MLLVSQRSAVFRSNACLLSNSCDQGNGIIAKGMWSLMVLGYHIVLDVPPPLWLFLGLFFKLMLLCLGIKCWIP